MSIHVSAGLEFPIRGRAGVCLLTAPRLFSTFAAALRIGVVAGAILIALLVAVVMFFAFWKPKATDSETAAGEAAKALAKGRSDLLQLRQLNMRLKNQQIRRLSEEICTTVDKIIRALAEQPKDVYRTRQLFNYYLPTLGEILRKYRALEESGIPASGTTENVVSGLETIRTAMEKQYANLFDDDILDLTVEMEVLKQICQRDGLLADEAFKNESGGQSVARGQ